MRSVIRRIRRLQRALPPIPPPRLVTEDDRRWAATTAALLRQMDPTHARVVREDLKRADGRGHQLNGLTIAFIACAWHHLRENQPLALPPEVAAIYLSGKYSATVYDCEDCGYDLPVLWPDPNAIPPTPLRVYFPQCPLCDGKVGWHAFYIKHRRYKSAGALLPHKPSQDAVECGATNSRNSVTMGEPTGVGS
jgi:hypothetical protein